MTTLFVGRIDAHAVAERVDGVEGCHLLADRLEDLLARTAHELDGELPTLDDRALVCVRRLDVALALDDGTTHDTARAWARTIGSTIAGIVDGAEPRGGAGPGVRSSGVEVVEFPDEAAALADLVASLAVGDRSRGWAWALVGLTGPADPAEFGLVSLDERRATTLGALVQRPDVAATAVVAAARAVGLAAVHRLLGPDGWLALADRLLQVAGSGVEVAALVDDPVPAPPAGDAAAPSAVLVTPFAEVAARCGLVVPPPTALGWAVVAVADARPDLLSDAAAPALLAALAGELATAARTGGVRHPPVVPSTMDRPGLAATPAGPATPEAPAATGPTRARAAHDQDAPDDGDEHDGGLATSYAGLLFLLTVAADAGLPERALDDPRLSDRAPSWVLANLALLLAGSELDDPAVRVFAGLDPRAHVEPLDPGTSEEEAALAGAAAGWAAATARRMDGATERPADDLELVRRVVTREGRVLAVPGWVEVVLTAADVDVDVRRAGLDLDPGFVRWIGTAVRFRYE